MKFPSLPPLPLGVIDEAHGFDSGQEFNIASSDRLRHLTSFGATGSGKTTLLHNITAWDMHHCPSLGMCIQDPHGDVYNSLLNVIPRHRTNDVILFDPLDPTHTLGLNVFGQVPPEMRPLVASTFVAAVKRLWEETSWGPRLERILRNAAYVLMDQPYPVALSTLPRLLTDDRFREAALRYVTNTPVRDFFLYEFNKWKPTDRAEAVSAVLNKIDVFLANPYLYAILGQTRSSFDFRWVMDTGKILLCNFRAGMLGDIECDALMSFMSDKFAIAAQSRQSIPPEMRRPFYLYIDEAHRIQDASLPNILNESRKFALFLGLFAQFPGQYSEKLRNAIFSNTGILACYRAANSEDAAFLTKQMMLDIPIENLQKMENYKMIAQVIATKSYTDPVTGETKKITRPQPAREVAAYPPFEFGNSGNAQPETVIAASRQRYGRERSRVAYQLATA